MRTPNRKTEIEGVISVIIPVYNAEAYLDKCINSVVDQTYCKLEIILVDDGSTDGSAQKCDFWKKTDQRIVVVHQKNGGAAAARNAALDVATGEYIMFVDADDYIAPELCERLKAELEVSGTECCICGTKGIDDKGQEIFDLCPAQKVVLTGIEAIRKRYIHQDISINIIGPCGKLFRRSLWRDLRFTAGLYYEDLDIVPDLYLQYMKIVCIPYSGYYYLQREGSCSHGKGTDDKRYFDSLIIREKHIARYRQAGEKEVAEEIMRMLIDLIITSDIQGWIPDAYVDASKKVFRRYWKTVLRKANLKNGVRYLIYRFGGKRIYSVFAKAV